jgi:hypothetical protein
MMRDSVQMFLDVFIIGWNALQGRYKRNPAPARVASTL